jgi:hypothetical protein
VFSSCLVIVEQNLSWLAFISKPLWIYFFWLHGYLQMKGQRVGNGNFCSGIIYYLQCTEKVIQIILNLAFSFILIIYYNIFSSFNDLPLSVFTIILTANPPPQAQIIVGHVKVEKFSKNRVHVFPVDQAVI